MATEKQIEANRRNSIHSTGPCTEAGREASAQNHLTLGLFTRRDYVKPEERDLYKEFCDGFYSELGPEGHIETALAAEIVAASWRLTRCSTNPPKKPAAPSNAPATPPTATSIGPSTNSAKSRPNEPSASQSTVKTSPASPNAPPASPNAARSRPHERNSSPHWRPKNLAFPNSSSMTLIA